MTEMTETALPIHRDVQARRARRGTDLAWLTAICVVCTFAGPWVLDTYLLNIVIKALFFAIAAVTVDLLWGYTGYLSFGHAASRHSATSCSARQTVCGPAFATWSQRCARWSVKWYDSAERRSSG